MSSSTHTMIQKSWKCSKLAGIFAATMNKDGELIPVLMSAAWWWMTANLAHYYAFHCEGNSGNGADPCKRAVIADLVNLDGADEKRQGENRNAVKSI